MPRLPFAPLSCPLVGLSAGLSVALALAATACGGSSRPPSGPGGPGGPAPTEPAPPPTIGTVELTISAAPGRDLPATVWYPAQKSGADAPPVLGRKLPVLVISHGLGGKKAHHAFLAERVAAEGYLVAAVEHLNDGPMIALQRPVDVTKLLDRLADGAAEPKWIAELADLEHVAVYGHSFGGYTALALAGAKIGGNPEWTAYCAGKPPQALGCPAVPPEQFPPTSLRDRRVDLAIGGAPGGYVQFGRAGTAAIEAPIVLIAATKDRLTPPAELVRPLFDHARQPRWYIELEQANHFSFVNLCDRLDKIPPPFNAEVAEGCAPDAPLDLLTANLLLGDIVIASLDHILKGRSAPDLAAIASARQAAAKTDAAR